MSATMTFENTYPRYPFAPLVRLALRLAAWLNSRRRAAQGGSDGALAGQPA